MIEDQKSNPERQIYEAVRVVYQTIHTSGLYKFTSTWVESRWMELDSALYEMEHLPLTIRRPLLDVMEGLREARNELRLARFLFDVPEIDPLYCLVMRNRAVLRGEVALCKLVMAWQVPSDDGARKEVT